MNQNDRRFWPQGEAAKIVRNFGDRIYNRREDARFVETTEGVDFAPSLFSDFRTHLYNLEMTLKTFSEIYKYYNPLNRDYGVPTKNLPTYQNITIRHFVKVLYERLWSLTNYSKEEHNKIFFAILINFLNNTQGYFIDKESVFEALEQGFDEIKLTEEIKEKTGTSDLKKEFADFVSNVEQNGGAFELSAKKIGDIEQKAEEQSNSDKTKDKLKFFNSIDENGNYKAGSYKKLQLNIEKFFGKNTQKNKLVNLSENSKHEANKKAEWLCIYMVKRMWDHKSNPFVNVLKAIATALVATIGLLIEAVTRTILAIPYVCITGQNIYKGHNFSTSSR